MCLVDGICRRMEKEEYGWLVARRAESERGSG